MAAVAALRATGNGNGAERLVSVNREISNAHSVAIAKNTPKNEASNSVGADFVGQDWILLTEDLLNPPVSNKFYLVARWLKPSEDEERMAILLVCDMKASTGERSQEVSKPGSFFSTNV